MSGPPHATPEKRPDGDGQDWFTQPAAPAPAGPAHPARALQKQVGNQAVQRRLREEGAAEHHSPPTSGPGSRQEPQILSESPQQQVSAMATDVYYRSPVNPDNPVLVWSDGGTLHFGPSQGQIAAGRMPPTPEPRFAPPPGYAAAELHWDRNDITGLGVGGAGGPLVVVARKAGEPDLVVVITNKLHQRTPGFTTSGLGGNARYEITRAGAAFFTSDSTTVPPAISGAPPGGAIHGISFSGGFVRYRATGDHDLYVEQGETMTDEWEEVEPEMAAYLVERSTGDITRRWARGTVHGVVGNGDGTVELETGQGAGRQTTVVDLRDSPPMVTMTQGHTTTDDPQRGALQARLRAIGVVFSEQRTRLSVPELRAVEEALTRSSNHGRQTLEAFRREILKDESQPLLEVNKVIGPDYAGGHITPSLPPTLHIQEPLAAPAAEQAATVRHEMTHIIAGAVDYLIQSRMSDQARADLEGAMRFEARRARGKARAGRLRHGEYGRGDPVPPPGTAAEWRGLLGHHPELAAIWVELLQRYSFIPDPEGTAELRGVSLADESRYLGLAERTGHPADSVSEFIASFVTCAVEARSAFVAAVLAAEAAGNARGGGGGSYLRRLYRRAWRIISETYVPLGANPF